MRPAVLPQPPVEASSDLESSRDNSALQTWRRFQFVQSFYIHDLTWFFCCCYFFEV